MPDGSGALGPVILERSEERRMGGRSAPWNEGDPVARTNKSVEALPR